MAWQVLGPEVIGKSAKQMFEHRKHGFHPNPGAIERDGGKRCHLQVTTHENNGPPAGDGKDKAHRCLDRFPKQIRSQVRDGFNVSIDLTRRLEEASPVDFKNLFEFDFFAVLAWTPTSAMFFGGRRFIGT